MVARENDPICTISNTKSRIKFTEIILPNQRSEGILDDPASTETLIGTYEYFDV